MSGLPHVRHETIMKLLYRLTNYLLRPKLQSVSRTHNEEDARERTTEDPGFCHFEALQSLSHLRGTLRMLGRCSDCLLAEYRGHLIIPIIFDDFLHMFGEWLYDIMVCWPDECFSLNNDATKCFSNGLLNWVVDWKYDTSDFRESNSRWWSCRHVPGFPTQASVSIECCAEQPLQTSSQLCRGYHDIGRRL